MAIFGMSYSPQTMTDHYQTDSTEPKDEEQKVAQEVMEKHKKDRE